MQRVILTTGGTGGHIFPALAVAEEIRKQYPDAMILFMGGQYGQEADLAVKAGLDFVGLPVRGVMGRGIRGVGAAFAMAGGIAKALGILRKTKPQIVIGFGGYAAFAGVSAARLAGVPSALHEQNAYPGMTNRLLGKVVNRVFLSMPDTMGAFPPGKCLMVGNPVRSGIVALYEQRKAAYAAKDAPASGTSYYGGVDGPSPFDVAARREQSGPGGTVLQQEEQPHDDAGLKKDEGKRPFRLLVMGGSLGARAINDGMVAAAPALLETGMEIRHQTGRSDYERVRAAYRDIGAEKLRLEPFIGDMPAAYAWADLVFCRAGASSLAEITAAALPCVLAPFPQAAQDHQRHNARFLASEGAALVLEQEEFLREPERIVQSILPLAEDRPRLAGMARKSFTLARPYAAASLVDAAEKLIRH